jgi:hypothetical protein
VLQHLQQQAGASGHTLLLHITLLPMLQMPQCVIFCFASPCSLTHLAAAYSHTAADWARLCGLVLSPVRSVPGLGVQWR